jgi:type VI secretion system secreted protein VgrG
LVSNPGGDLAIVNTGNGMPAQYEPNLSVGQGQTVQGNFHTHPYDTGVTGASLSGGDAAHLILSRQNVIIAQSGSDQFMYLRTAQTPDRVDAAALNNAQNQRIRQLMLQGGTPAAATQQAAAETARTYGLAYYQGKNGIFHKVGP